MTTHSRPCRGPLPSRGLGSAAPAHPLSPLMKETQNDCCWEPLHLGAQNQSLLRSLRFSVQYRCLKSDIWLTFPLVQKRKGNQRWDYPVTYFTFFVVPYNSPLNQSLSPWHTVSFPWLSSSNIALIHSKPTKFSENVTAFSEVQGPQTCFVLVSVEAQSLLGDYFFDIIPSLIQNNAGFQIFHFKFT